jgi:hypothetical protein
LRRTGILQVQGQGYVHVRVQLMVQGLQGRDLVNLEVEIVRLILVIVT